MYRLETLALSSLFIFDVLKAVEGNLYLEIAVCLWFLIDVSSFASVQTGLTHRTPHGSVPIFSSFRASFHLNNPYFVYP
jgi:hypothetical protein